jgi:hypothetical protein
VLWPLQQRSVMATAAEKCYGHCSREVCPVLWPLQQRGVPLDVIKVSVHSSGLS